MRVDQATTQPQPATAVAAEATPPALADSAVLIPYNSSSPSQFAQLLNAADTAPTTPPTPSATATAPTTTQTPGATITTPTTPSAVTPLPQTSAAATPTATPYGSATTLYNTAPTTESGAPAPYGAATTPGATTSMPYATAASPYAAIPSGASSAATSPYGTVPQTPYGAAASPYATAASPYATAASPYATATSPYATATSPYATATSPYGAVQTPYGAVQTPYGTMVAMPMMVLVPYGLTPYGMAAQSQGMGGASGVQAASNPDVAAAAGSTQPVSLIAPFHGSAPITQPFGPTSFAAEPAYNGYSHFHTGLDFGVPLDTPIDAAAAGRVVSAGWDNTGFGNCVVIDHGNGLRTLYGHLSSVAVQPGQIVQAGQQIGLSGTTGNSTGPHLHLGVEQDGKWVDPAPLLGLSGDATAISDSTTTPANAATAPALPGALTTPAALGGGTAATAATASGMAAAPGAASSGTAGVVTGDILPAPSGSGMAAMLPLIQRVATATGVSGSLLAGVVQAESGGDPQAVSPSGAKGLMQLMDATAHTYGVLDPFDPQQNLVGGAMYLRGLLQRYHGDEQLAVAAYNAGPGAVDKYGGVPPYAETQQYVQRVAAYEQQFSGQ